MAQIQLYLEKQYFFRQFKCNARKDLQIVENNSNWCSQKYTKYFDLIDCNLSVLN